MSKMTNNLKVAAAQLSPIFLNKEKTVEKACNAILEAGKNDAKLIVFPEAFISGYPDWVWLIPNSKGTDLNELYLKDGAWKTYCTILSFFSAFHMFE